MNFFDHVVSNVDDLPILLKSFEKKKKKNIKK